MSQGWRPITAAAVVAAVALAGCRRTSYSTAPDPTPTATPAPVAPAPTPTPPPIGCGLPPAGGSGNGCPYLAPAFVEDVNRAIAEAQNEHPALFDFNDGFGMLSWKVKDRKKYYDVVKYNLERMGYCAAHDLEEIGVKNVNRFNEQYQIMTSYGYSRWGAGAYRATCFPAWF
ncbi:MAG TPA: hypothetical protein VMR21_09500 [Vicinamibacteria bacterium]|nr:hypothetical protein [Vicinamibacteria bacterium]